MPDKAPRARRSVLYVPATNERALAKAVTLACDCIVVDLEDAVAKEAKADARKAVHAFMTARPADGREYVVRVNALSTRWGREDIEAARACAPDAILLPKVETPSDMEEADAALGADAAIGLWAMIETPRALLDIAALAVPGGQRTRLSCLVAGTNDLVKDTGVRATPDRRYLLPWLMQIVLAARAGGLDVLDGVSNDFRDLDAFARECEEARNMGFDGKTLIHPAQIAPANAAFSPGEDEIAEARTVVAAFAAPGNAGKGVVSIEGRMVERLHLVQAERLLARADRDVSRI